MTRRPMVPRRAAPPPAPSTPPSPPDPALDDGRRIDRRRLQTDG